MAISEHASGSQACSINTEHVLTANPETGDAVIQIWLDLDPLANGDILEVRLKEKVRSSGTQRTAQTWVVANDKGSSAWVTDSFLVLHGWDVTLKQIAGTGRTIEWSIRKVA